MVLESRPARIILVRHGESLGNIDDTAYETVPDHALPLTELGIRQGQEAGERVRALAGSAPLMVYGSPYVRVHQTIEAMRLGVPMADVRFEPRLREQDWANFQDPADVAAQKKLRNDYGHFYYRFTHGESGADVYERVSTFLESLFRNLESRTPDDGGSRHVVIVTHGLTMRLFCMRWFHWSVDYFEALENPHNGESVVLERQADSKYKLAQPFRQWNAAYVPTERERSSWV